MDYSKVTMLDNIFSMYLMKNIGTKDLEKQLTSALNSLSGQDKHFEVTFINNMQQKEPFFGFRVFPILGDSPTLFTSMTDEKCSFKNVYDKWKHIDNWYVEMDSNIFNRNEINFTPKELTAILLHELGHVVYSDNTIERLYRAHREVMCRLSTENKMQCKFMYRLFDIPLMVAAGIRNFRDGKNGINLEVFADTTVSKLGYGVHLITAFNKIIKAYGNSISLDDRMQEKMIESEVQWAVINATDLIGRRDIVKNELYYKQARTTSGYLKRMILDIAKRIGVKRKEKYSALVSPLVDTDITLESTMDYLDKYELVIDTLEFSKLASGYKNVSRRATAALEAFGKNKKVEIPTQLDIDSIAVEIDSISNHMDRRYVLDLIYNQIERIEKYREVRDMNPSVKKINDGMLDAMLNELESLRKATLLRKDFKKDYKVFVQYPVGYEG